MTEEEFEENKYLIRRIEAECIWRFPFEFDSPMGESVLDDSILFEDYIAAEETHYSTSSYKYTSEELKSSWNCILHQRLFKRAAILSFIKDIPFQMSLLQVGFNV